MKYLLFILLSLLAVTGLRAEDAPTEAAIDSPKTTLSYWDGFVLGLVEGVTEYLPISSTGHLILTNQLLELDADTPLFSESGEPIYHKDLDDAGMPIPFTLADAANAYAIIIQVGAIAAVLLIYWQRILTIVWGILGKNPHGFLLARNLICAFLPAAVLGLLFDDLIEHYLFGPIPVIIALVAGAFLMLGVERGRKKRGVSENSGPDLHQLSIRQSVIIGFMQCVAMWPGTSRSMMTIVGGYVVGLSPRLAAEFSFLLGLITLSAASGYKALTLGPYMVKTLDLGPVLFGIVVAAVSAAFAVKWLVNYLTKHGLALFAWYRIALAVVVGAYIYFG